MNKEQLVENLLSIISKIDNITNTAKTDNQIEEGNIGIVKNNMPTLALKCNEDYYSVGVNSPASDVNAKKQIIELLKPYASESDIGKAYEEFEHPFTKSDKKRQNIRVRIEYKDIKSVIHAYAGVNEGEKVQKVLFCRITSMKYYQDIDGDIQDGGGSYTESNLAHERLNFLKRDDRFKGFSESGSKNGGMNLKRIYPDNISDSVNGVLVIFVANNCIVGYYKDATVYDTIQNKENYDKGNYDAHNIETESKAVLLSENARNYQIPRGKGGMGQSNIFYVYDDKGNKKQDKWIQDAVNYVQINKLVKSYIPLIVKHLENNPKQIDELINNNFGTTSYPLIETVEAILERDRKTTNDSQTLNYRHWKDVYTINGIEYRFHSQWGGHKIWNGQNNSISLDEKHRESFMDYIENTIKTNRYWVVSPNVNGKNEPEKFKTIMEYKQCVLMGWDTSNVLEEKFSKKMQIGDLVLIAGRSNKNKEVFACGLVSSKSKKEDKGYWARDLQYFTKLPENNGLSFTGCTCGESKQIKAIYQLHPNKNECDKKVIEYLLNIIKDKREGGTMIDAELQEKIDLLKYKKQIILQGSPGTGKTRLATQIAKQIAPNNYKLIQFHPAYSYEDFVRGIVAKTTDKGVMYETQNKVLAEMAEMAEKANDNHEKFVLIIDEINRANLSSVLGELIYALEYRGKAVESMYEYQGSRKITLPKNLYIIGTMNTADRSVGYIDYAIRRRFAFVNIDTDESVIPEKALPLFKKVEKLFEDNLSEEFYKNDVMIGHSYFLNADLKMALEYEIKPILLEYLKDGVLTCNKTDITDLYTL